MKAKRYGPAAALYDSVLKSAPKDPAIYADAAFVHGEIKQYRKAADLYEKAIRMGVKDPQVFYGLASIYEKLGQKKEAVAFFEKAAAARPSVETYNVLSLYYMKEKRYDDAIRIYGKLIALAPKKANNYSNMGRAYGLKGDVDKEIQYYQQALKYDREDDAVHFAHGEAYEKKGQLDEALAAYKSAYALNPESPAARKIPSLNIRILQKRNP